MMDRGDDYFDQPMVTKGAALGVWVYDHESVPGYTLSIRYQETYHGPLITDLCISVSEPPELRAARSSDEPGPWLAEFYLEPTTPGVVPREVTIQALQSIRMADILEAVRKALPEPEQIDDTGWREFVAAIREGDRPRRRDEHFYAAVAALYVEVAAEMQRGVYDEMAERAPELRLAPASLRDVVKEAKRRGFIRPAAKRGQAGGVLTDKARKYLRVEDE